MFADMIFNFKLPCVFGQYSYIELKLNSIMFSQGFSNPGNPRKYHVLRSIPILQHLRLKTTTTDTFPETLNILGGKQSGVSKYKP